MTVRKSAPVLVKPLELEPTTARSGKINLSPFDKVLVGMTPPSSLLVFEHPIHEAAESIKRALSRALVHYYPIAGRVVYAGGHGCEDDEAHIHCNDEGVAFVAASASCALKDLGLFFDRSPDARMETASLVDELAVYYPAGVCGPADPLLLMQVTQFSCGGFLLGATWNHGVADGAGMAQFLQAVAELSLGSPSPSILPLRWDGSLMSLPPSKAELTLQLVTSLEPMLDLAFLGITIPSSSVNRIKAEFCYHSNGLLPCTVFEAIVAVLWQCRTRAVMSSPDSPVVLQFVVNVRKHVGAKDGYYGNCIRPQPIMATSGAVANADIVDLVKMIKRAEDEIPNQLKKIKKEDDSDDHQLMSLQPSVLDQQQKVDDLQYNMLAVTSWRNLGFEKVDFGAGTPARVLCCALRRQPFPLCVVSPPCKGNGDDGDGHNNVFCLCVKEEHVGAFVRELARFT